MQTPFLIGARIYFRPLERADAPMIQQWINDPEIRKFLRIYLPMNLAAEERYIDSVSGNGQDLSMLIVRTDNDRPIGSVGLHKIDYKNRHAEFGIMIGVQEEQNQGFGGEATRLMVGYAIETLNLNRVELHVYEFNPRALRVYEKAGFRKEGVLRQHHYADGRYWDTTVMSILREEWLTRKK
jgi:RimJ/RimL family protein N-acetyltransferase